MPLNGHLDGTSGGAGLKAALCTGSPKSGALPTSTDKQSLTSKPEQRSRGYESWMPIGPSQAYGRVGLTITSDVSNSSLRVTGQACVQPTSLTHHGAVCTQLKRSTRPPEAVQRLTEPLTLPSDQERALTQRPSTVHRRQPGGAHRVGTPSRFRFQPGVAKRQTMAVAKAL